MLVLPFGRQCFQCILCQLYFLQGPLGKQSNRPAMDICDHQSYDHQQALTVLVCSFFHTKISLNALNDILHRCLWLVNILVRISNSLLWKILISTDFIFFCSAVLFFTFIDIFHVLIYLQKYHNCLGELFVNSEHFSYREGGQAL